MKTLIEKLELERDSYKDANYYDEVRAVERCIEIVEQYSEWVSVNEESQITNELEDGD